MITHNTKIYVAGHTGMVGSACLRLLKSKGYNNLIFTTSKELDLRSQNSVEDFFKTQKPEAVILAAAKVGGILANKTYGYDFLMDNLNIQNNILSASEKYKVQKLVFLGSSCIYPKMALQPIKENYLLTGSLEETNQWYSIAKIAGVKAVEALNKYKKTNYISLMPTNLYGPNDNYDKNNSHVLPALIRKFNEAKSLNKDVYIWGSGEPLREFLHVDDLAEAVLFVLEKNNLKHSLYNVGSGHEISIKNLAILIQDIVGHNGEIKNDKTKPDGTPRKILDSSLLHHEGWRAQIGLKEGIIKTYKDFLAQEDEL